MENFIRVFRKENGLSALTAWAAVAVVVTLSVFFGVLALGSEVVFAAACVALAAACVATCVVLVTGYNAFFAAFYFASYTALLFANNAVFAAFGVTSSAISYYAALFSNCATHGLITSFVGCIVVFYVKAVAGKLQVSYRKCFGIMAIEVAAIFGAMLCVEVSVVGAVIIGITGFLALVTIAWKGKTEQVRLE